MKLEPGEVICDKCGGTGKFIEESTEQSIKWSWCPKCHGEKKVDWVNNAIWKKYTNIKGNNQKAIFSKYKPFFSEFEWKETKNET